MTIPYGPVRSPVRSANRSAVSGGAQDFQDFTTKPTASPSGASVTLGATEDGVILYVPMFDLITYPEGVLAFIISDGTNTYVTMGIWGQTLFLKGFTPGSTLSIGCTTLTDTGVSIAMTAATVETPASYIDVPGSPVTGTINCDRNYPDEWTAPTTERVTLPYDSCIFQIDYTGGTRQMPVYFREKKNGVFGPIQWVLLKPGRKIPVYARYRHIYFCCPDTLALPIEGPTGTVIDTASASDVLSYEDEFDALRPGGSRDVTITNQSEFNGWIGAPQEWDKATVTAAAITITDINATLIAAGKNILLKGQSGSASHTITGAWQLAAANVANKITIKGLTLVSNSANTIGLQFYEGTWRYEDVRFMRNAGSRANSVILNPRGLAGDYRMFACHAGGVEASMLDCWNTRSNGGDVGAIFRLIGCTASNAGNSSGPNQLLTPHDQTKLMVYGGSFTDPGNGSAVSGDVDGSNIYLVGSYFDDGATTRPIRFGDSAQNRANVLLFVHAKDLGDTDNSNVSRTTIGCRLEMGGVSHAMITSSTFPYVLVAIGNTFIQSPAAGTCHNLNIPIGWFIIGNDYKGFQRAYRIETPISTPDLAIIANNVDNNTSGVNVAREDQLSAYPMSIMFNIMTGNPTANPSTINAKNVKVDGNISSGTEDTDITQTGTNKRNSVTPLAGTWSTSPTNLDSEGAPQSSSNCDWTQFASALSAGQKTTLRDLIPWDMGLISPEGDPLYISGDSVCRGARERHQIPSGVGLFMTRR